MEAGTGTTRLDARNHAVGYVYGVGCRGIQRRVQIGPQAKGQGQEVSNKSVYGWLDIRAGTLPGMRYTIPLLEPCHDRVTDVMAESYARDLWDCVGEPARLITVHSIRNAILNKLRAPPYAD
jgi:hypothetical protein